MRALLHAATWVAWLATGASAAPPAPLGSFDYFYVEANEGGSSGGHTAIRFGGETYHFQNRDGLLVLDRDRTDDFLHDYALVNNRTVVASRVAAAPADVERIRRAFDLRYQVQRRQLDVASALAEDRELLETWSRGEQPGIPGLGYFASSPAVDRAPAVARLRDRIEARYGAGHLAERRLTAIDRLATVAGADPAAWAAPAPVAIRAHPPFAAPWARRYRDTAAAVGAVDVLEAAAGLDAEAVVAPAGPRYWLDATELSALRARRPTMEDELVRIAGSPRADWGRPFLVGLARLLALDASLARGRLVVLDVLPEDARELPFAVLDARRDAVAAMYRFASLEIEALRLERVERDGSGERLDARLEGVVNRVFELEASLRGRRDLRLARGTLLPLRAGAPWSALPGRRAEAPEIARDLARVREREERVEEGLDDLYHYHLITQNCVSELFHTIDHALGGAAGSERALGGHIDGDRDLSFVPFISAQAVDERYRVVERRVIPSYRELQLQSMRRQENAWWVALRESNTLTARSYRRGHGDSYFLFFTDDQPLLRPVFGAFNLLAATFESLVGLAWAPVDRGDTLVSGLEGMVVSLPELAFWNIRKGSNDWVAPQPQPLD